MKLSDCRKCKFYDGEIDGNTVRCRFWNTVDYRLIVPCKSGEALVIVCPSDSMASV